MKKLIFCLLFTLPSFASEAKYEVIRLNDIAGILLNKETGETFISTPCLRTEAEAYINAGDVKIPFRCWIKMDTVEGWSDGKFNSPEVGNKEKKGTSSNKK